MSVREMGDLLGIKKTERYWLVHRNYFETIDVMGRMYVDVKSFEHWYANQVRYCKITGEEPGAELKENSYSVRDMADMLGISEHHMRTIIREDHIETITVENKRRVTGKVFDAWYQSQSRHRTEADRQRDQEKEQSTLSMPQLADLLGIAREEVYALLGSSEYGSVFETVVIADRRRITKESIKKFLEICFRKSFCDAVMEKGNLPISHGKHIFISNTPKGAATEFRIRKNRLMENGKDPGNTDYLTLHEAAILMGVTEPTISRWADKGYIRQVRTGPLVRIVRTDMEALIERGDVNGIYKGAKR